MLLACAEVRHRPLSEPQPERQHSFLLAEHELIARVLCEDGAIYFGSVAVVAILNYSRAACSCTSLQAILIFTEIIPLIDTLIAGIQTKKTNNQYEII